MMRAHRWTLSVSCLLALAACGGEPTPIDSNAPTGPVSATVAPEGTSMRVVDEDGASLDLDFPAGAVDEAFVMTVSPRPSAAGARASFELDPSGLLLSAPVEMTFVAAPDTALEPNTTFTVGPADAVYLLPSTRSGTRTLSASTRVLGAAAAETAVATLQGGGGLTGVADIECQLALASLLDRLERARLFPFSSSESAYRLVQEIEATVTLCEADPEYFEDQRPILQAKACDGYRDAAVNAVVASKTTADELRAAVRPILAWTAAKQLTGTECGRPPNEHITDIEQGFDDFITAYGGRIDAGDLPSNYHELWWEVKGVVAIEADGELLGVPDAAQSVREQLLERMYDLLRDAAYAHCRSEDQQAYLVDLLWDGGYLRHPVPTALGVSGSEIARSSLGSPPQSASFTADDLLDDIQYCATHLELGVERPDDAPLPDLMRVLQGGATPGQHTTSATTRAPATGRLTLDGGVAAFQCASPDRASDDDLVVHLDGTEVDRVTRIGPLLLGTRTLDVGAILATADLDPTVLRTYPLEIKRAGEACGGSFGLQDATMFTVDLEVDPIPEASGASVSPATLTAETEPEFTFTLPWSDEGTNLERLHVTYDLAGVAHVDDIELATSAAVDGFSGASGTGTLRQAMYVGCGAAGDNPIVITMVLEDEFGQRSEERQVFVSVDYGACPSVTATRSDSTFTVGGER